MAMSSPVTDPRGPSELARHALNYHRFMLGVKWAAIHFAAVIALLTLWFATPAGLGWAVLAAALIVAAGVYAMTHGMAHSSEGDTLG